MLSPQRKEIEHLINDLLSDLPLRSRDVLEKRFGLQMGKSKETLESIGRFYNITRERVRQIENGAKELIAESDKFKKNTNKIITKLTRVLDNFGGIVSEKDFLKSLTEYRTQRHHLKFLMELSEPFGVQKNNEFYDNIWFTDEENYNGFVKSLNSLYKNIDTDELLTKEEIINRFLIELKLNTNNKKILKTDVVKKLITISKKIGSNSLDQWGLSESRNISTKGAKDHVYLILKKENQPMHFRDVAEEVRKQFASDINTATCHNELIKDDRFIIIGRGIYGLKEWGQYSGDTVAEVIIEIMKKAKKALTLEEITEKVLEQKQVKKQTIVINLGNKHKFKRLKIGKYTIA